MEEILTSIRKIMHEEDDTSRSEKPSSDLPGDQAQRAVDGLFDENVADAQAPLGAGAEAENDDDTLALTSDMVHQVSDTEATADDEDIETIDTVSSGFEKVVGIEDRDIDFSDVRAKADAPAPGKDQTILSHKTQDQVRDLMSQLSHLRFEEKSQTVEALVAELLRPMLKVWLDAHLPALVERIVAEEVKRLSDRLGP